MKLSKRSLSLIGVFAFAGVLSACSPSAPVSSSRAQPTAEDVLARLIAIIRYDPETQIEGWEFAPALAVPGAYETLMALYAEALASSPGNRDVLFGRVGLNSAMNHHDLVLADVDAMIATNPEDGSDYGFRCWYKGLHNIDLAGALADCERLIALDARAGITRRRSGALNSRGLVWLRLGEYRRAIADYDEVLRTDPDYAIAMFPRGIAKLRLGDKRGGTSDIRAVERRNPGTVQWFAEHGVNP